MRNSKGNMLNVLPSRKEGLQYGCEEALEEALKNLEDSPNYYYQKTILMMFLSRCTSSSSDFYWDCDTYLEIAKEIIYADQKVLDASCCFFIKCLTTSNSELKHSLKQLAEKVDFYPGVIRTYSPEEKKYEVFPKEIQIMDNFQLMSLFYSKMKRCISNDVTRLYYHANDKEELCETIAEINRNGNLEQKDALLSTFDATFSYLTEIPLYNILYQDFRNVYLDLLEKQMWKFQRKNMWEKNSGSDRLYYDYKVKQVEKTRRY